MICDICGAEAAYDAKTVQGFWAYLCPIHYQEMGVGLGIGKGQHLGEKVVCPGCGYRYHTKTVVAGVFQCLKCQAIHGETTLAVSFEIVFPAFVSEEPPPENLRYYDFTCQTPEGKTIRRHGFYDVKTRYIVQVG